MRTNSKRLSLGMAFALVALPALAQSSEVQGKVELGAQRGQDLGPVYNLGKYEVIPTGSGLYNMNLFWEGPSNYWMEYIGSDVGTLQQSSNLYGGKRREFKWNLNWDQQPYYVSQSSTTPYVEVTPGVFRLPDAMRSTLQGIFWTPAAGSISVNGADQRIVALGAELGFWTLGSPYTAANSRYPASDVDLGTLRRTGKAGFEYTGLDNWIFGVNYRIDRRDGNQATPMYDGTTIVQFASPINYRTDNLHANAEYAKGRWFGEVSVDFSKFDDRVSTLYVDNPMRLTNVAGQQQAAVLGMPTLPDNKATGLSFAGGVNLPMKHRLVMTYSTTTMTMDTDLMPGSTIPFYAEQRNDPSGNFIGAITAKMENTLLTAKITGEPIPRFGYSLSYRKFELKDKTEEYQFALRGRGDSTAPTADLHGHEDESWKKESIKAEVHTTALKGIRLGLAFGEDKAEYATREAEEVKDTSITLNADGHYGITSFHASYTDLKRTPTYDPARATLAPGMGITNVLNVYATGTVAGGNFIPAGAPVGAITGTPYPTNAASNQTDQAKRNSTLYNLVFTVTPVDTLAISLTAFGIDNKFPESYVHGLQKSTNTNYGVDFSYTPNERISFVAAYILEDFKFDFTSAYLNSGTSNLKPIPPYPAGTVAVNVPNAMANDTWGNNTKDKVDTFKLGARMTFIPGKLDGSLDWDYSKGRSDSSYAVQGLYPGAPSATIAGSWQANGYNANPWGVNTTGSTWLPYYGLNNSITGPFLDQPQVMNKTTILKARLNYHQSKQLTFSLLYWMQKYDSADYGRDIMAPYMYNVDPGTSKSLFLGARPIDYDAKILRASISYRF